MVDVKQFFPYSVCNNYYYCWGQRSIRTYHSHYLSEIYYFHSGRFLMAFYDMLLIIYEKCQDRCTGTGASLTDKENMVRKVMDYVEQNFAEEITLDSLVKQFHVSKQYLSKIFREITGLTIMEYIYRRRINQAKILFYLEKENAVTDVCFKVGFKHLSQIVIYDTTGESVELLKEKYGNKLEEKFPNYDFIIIQEE